jgi:hypothetical protein
MLTLGTSWKPLLYPDLLANPLAFVRSKPHQSGDGTLRQGRYHRGAVSNGHDIPASWLLGLRGSPLVGCWRGETGKRDGIGVRWAKALVGSSPTASTPAPLTAESGRAYLGLADSDSRSGFAALDELDGKTPFGSFALRFETVAQRALHIPNHQGRAGWRQHAGPHALALQHWLALALPATRRQP